MVGAGRVIVAWEAGEEPWVRVATWADSRLTVTRHAPGTIEPLVPAELTRAVILCTGPLTPATVSLVTTGGAPTKWQGLPLHATLRAQLSGGGLASAPFDTEHVTGRAFFSDLGEPTAESAVLTEVIARAIGTSIGQLHVSQQLRDIGAREQRIQLARDLHDGVLQSLTGVRLELQGIAGSLDHDAAAVGRERVLSVERALAVEQRELRLFIQGLTPPVTVVPDGTTLASRLQDVRERVLLEWKVPVTIRVDPRPIQLSAALEQALPMMAHEAIVNALKHAQPSRISVDVNPDGNSVRLVVADDGAGFAVQGRYDHEALLRMNLGPVSLRERAAALGGRMSIESSGAGSRVEIVVPMAAGAA
jgi:signal transduction histidine kinase